MRRSKVVPQTSRLLTFSSAEISNLKKHSDFEFPNRLCLCLCIRLCVHHCQRLCRMIVADVLLFPTMFNMLITMTKSWKYRSFNWRIILRGLYVDFKAFMGVILHEQSHSKVGTLWVRQIYQSHDYKTAACVNCSILCVVVCVCVCVCVCVYVCVCVCVCVGGGLQQTTEEHI